MTSVFRLIFLCLLMVTCRPGQKPMLRGQLPKGCHDEDVMLTYTLTGETDSMTCVVPEVSPAGVFTATIDSLPPEGVDVTIMLGQWVCGARLQKGKTLDVHFTSINGEGEYEARFKGANADMSRFLTVFNQTFDPVYYAPDPDDPRCPAEHRQRLDSCYQSLVKAYALLPADCRPYYVRLSEAMYASVRIQILMDQAFEENRSLKTYEEYRALTSNIDPNNPVNLRAGMTAVWLSVAHSQYTESDGVPYYIESLQLIDRHITDPLIRAAMFRHVSSSFQAYSYGLPNPSAFWTAYSSFARIMPTSTAVRLAIPP